MNTQTGEIRAWDSLTDEQKTSGDWIKLPPYNSDGHCIARRATAIDSAFPKRDTSDFGARIAALEKERGTFDALGRPKL